MTRKPIRHIAQGAAQSSTAYSETLAWTWASYKAVLPQTNDEERALSDLKFRLSNRTVVLDTSKQTAQKSSSQTVFLAVAALMIVLSLPMLITLANTVVRLQSYQEANFVDLCGPAANPSGDPVEFIQKHYKREQCLNATTPDASLIQERVRLLRDAIFKE